MDFWGAGEAPCCVCVSVCECEGVWMCEGV